MKKKLVTLFLCIATASCLAIGLAACSGGGSNSGGNTEQGGGSSDTPTHEHSLEAHSEVAATCTKDGNIAYWVCTDCGKYFSDKNGKTEISPDAIVVAASGHNFVDGKCTVCDKAEFTEGLEYTLSDDETYYICSGIGTATETDISIAKSYNGKPVASIGYAAFVGCGLTSVTIPDSVTSIGSWAFNEWIGLTSIVIPDSVTSVGDDVFRDCMGLTIITMSNSVTSIGERVFCGCYVLSSITIPNGVTSIGYAAFSSPQLNRF